MPPGNGHDHLVQRGDGREPRATKPSRRARPAPGSRRRRAGRRSRLPAGGLRSQVCGARAPLAAAVLAAGAGLRPSCRAGRLLAGVSGKLAQCRAANPCPRPRCVSNAVSLSPRCRARPDWAASPCRDQPVALISSGGPVDDRVPTAEPEEGAPTSMRAARRTTTSAANILRAETPRGSSSSSTGSKPRQSSSYGRVSVTVRLPWVSMGGQRRRS